MGVELKDKERNRIAVLAQKGLIAPFPDGPLLPRFDALELAQALERLLTECAERGHTKVSLHLDLIDAQALATALRKLALLK